MYYCTRHINYWWRRDSGKPISQKHIKLLEASAEQHIFEMRKEGYSSGELNECLGKTEIGYTGWWQVTNDEGE